MNAAKSIGTGFIPLFTALFVALKLTGHIDWSWLWVLSPLWLPFALIAVMFMGTMSLFVGLFFLAKWSRRK